MLLLGGVQPCSAFNWRGPFRDTFRSTRTFSKAFWWLFEAIRITGWGLLIFWLRRVALCFPGWSWYHSILDCQAGWGSLRFLGRKRIGTYNSQNSFQDVLGPFCIGWLLRLGEAGNSRSAFNWRQRGITFSFFSQMTPSFGSEPPLHMRCRQI